MSVRMRHTRAHTGNRRSHHALKEPRLSSCVNCGEYHVRHRMCPHCGTYKGKEVVDVVAKTAKKEAKRKAKRELIGKTGAGKEESKASDLDAKELSSR